MTFLCLDASIRRDLTAPLLSPEVWLQAVNAGFLPEEDRTPEQCAARTLASLLADELLSADAAVIAAPLYNYGVAWTLCWPGHGR